MSDVDATENRRGVRARRKLLGIAVAFLGGAILVNGYLKSLELVTTPTGWVPTQYNTAVAFVFTGMAIVAHCVRRRRWSFVCGLVAAGVGSVALAEQMLSQELRFVDWIFAGQDLPSPGEKTAPNTGLCLSMAASLILVFSAPRSTRRWRELTGGVIAALLAAAGFVGLLEYTASDGVARDWALFTRMDGDVALAFVGLGIAFFAMVGYFRGPADRHLPRWAPWAAGLGVATLIVSIWIGLSASEKRLRSMAATWSHEAALSHVEHELGSHMRELQSLSTALAHVGSGTEPDLEAEARLLADELPGLVGLAYVDKRDEVRFSYVTGDRERGRPHRALPGDPRVVELLAAADAARDVTVSQPMAIGDAPLSLVVCLPVERAGGVRGRLVAQHSVPDFFDAVFADRVTRAYDVELSAADGRIFYRSYGPYARPRWLDPERRTASEARAPIAFGDQVWTVRGAADPTLAVARKSPSNALLLWLGTFLAAAIALVIRKSQLILQRTAKLRVAKRLIEDHAESLRHTHSELEIQTGHLRGVEEHLRHAAREKRRVLDSLSAFLIGIDEDGVVTEWNVVSSELFGLRSAEVLGKRFDELRLPWDRETVEDAIIECRAANARVRRDGLKVAADESRDERVASFTVNPTQDGARCGVSIIGADVTERQILEMQLHHAQKLESVGTLAAGIAHEINTPMQFLGDNVRFLHESAGPITELIGLVPDLLKAANPRGVPPGLARRIGDVAGEVDLEFLSSEMPLAVEEALEGIDRVTTIVHAMKDFSHPGGQVVEFADINKAIETTLAVARNEYKHDAVIATDFGDLPRVECWITDLNQVFLNLLVNATHAIRAKLGEGSGRKGTIRISTRRDGDEIEVRFTDSGVGIPEELRPKIFDQFFTTKPIGAGTGLGLAIARSVVVEKHGGNIFFETEVGVGTTFVFRIPVERAAAHVNASHC